MSGRFLIERMHPQVRPPFARFVDACEGAGIPVRVIMTLRTPAEQDRLYALGRTAPGRIVTNARGHQSYHCWAVAADIAPLSVLSDRNWAPEANEWKVMAHLAEQCGLEHTVKNDLPHWDYREGHSWREWYDAFPSLKLPNDYFTRIPT